jgi:hypothetical protein
MIWLNTRSWVTSATNENKKCVRWHFNQETHVSPCPGYFAMPAAPVRGAGYGDSCRQGHRERHLLLSGPCQCSDSRSGSQECTTGSVREKAAHGVHVLARTDNHEVLGRKWGGV